MNARVKGILARVFEFDALRLRGRALAVNLSLYLFGVIFLSLGAVMTFNAHLGMGSGDALNFAVADLFGLPRTAGVIAVGAVMLPITALIRGSFPRLATFLTSFIMGLFTDLWEYLFGWAVPTQMPWRILLFAAGVLVICLSVAAYMTSVFPTNPPDDLLRAITDRGVPTIAAKLALDGTCLVIAWLLHGEVSWGTLVLTLAIGPLIALFRKAIQRLFKPEFNT